MTNEQEKSEKTADELERELTEKEYARMLHARNVEIETEEQEKRLRRMWGDDYQDYVIEYVFD